MHRVIASLFALLLSVFLLVMGNGLHGTLLPVRARLEGFSFTQIGLLGTVYFVGFLLGCLLSGRVIRQVGHIRTFAVHRMHMHGLKQPAKNIKVSCKANRQKDCDEYYKNHASCSA